jgi:hypothetical protein
MQRVARAVAGENAALRGLLAAKGVSAEEVEAHVEAVKREERAIVKTGVSSVTPASTPSCTASPVEVASRPMLCSQSQPQAYGPVRENSNPPFSFQPKIYSPPTPATTVTSCTEESGCCPRPQPQSQPQPQLQPQQLEAQGPRSPDKIHCMEAATILAQIRGHSDVSNARASLGCASNDNCMVRNTDLLNLMDEMT